MLPGTGGQTTRTCAKDSNVAKLEENCRVYWLPGSAAESTDGAPWSMKFRVARLVVEAITDSDTDFDVNATRLEESEETRRLKHYARQIAHLQSRSRSGEIMDQAHRPQASTHEGEDRSGKDHLFLSNADPEQVKAVLNRLESGSSISSYVGKQSRSQIGGRVWSIQTN